MNLLDCEKILVQSQHSEDRPGILLFYPDRGEKIVESAIELVLVEINTLVQNGKLMLVDKSISYCIFIPVKDYSCPKCNALLFVNPDDQLVCLLCGEKVASHCCTPMLHLDVIGSPGNWFCEICNKVIPC